MRARANTSGFTVIETMLFLAISGMLILLVLVGSSIAIDTQRYRDSVNSLVDIIQSQYVEVANPSNENNITGKCQVVLDPTHNRKYLKIVDSTSRRGQSDCLIAGRYIRSEGSGYGNTNFTKFEIFTIYALRAPTASSSSLQYDFFWGLKRETEYALNWGATAWLKSVGVNDKAKLSVAIVRNPITNKIETYQQIGRYGPDGEHPQLPRILANIFDPRNKEKRSEICIKTSSPVAGSWQYVEIAKGATGPNSVERKSGEDASRCVE